MSVRDHVMVAHSLPHPFFGPAQAKHGATYDVELVLAARELDEHPAFVGRLTTTEVLARWVADRVVEAGREGGSAAGLTRGLASLEVVLRETPDAWASYRTDEP